MIEKAWELIKALSGDDRSRAAAEAAGKARMDLGAWLDGAREEGPRKGEKKGRKGKRLEFSRKLPRRKTPFEPIVETAGLPLEQGAFAP
jgi:hypothetical protein